MMTLNAWRTGARWWRPFAALLLSLLLSGCASVYVDNGVPEVPSAQFAKPAQAQPVQVFFEFQTKGAPNGRASELVRGRVVNQVKDSGLFSTVVEQADPGAGLLSITINNVPLSDDAFTKGFVTGLTFGLAGTQVSDGYVCTARYTPPGGGSAVVKTARHAIHTTVGASGAPQNATKAESVGDAVFTMSRQVVSQLLNELSRDPAFAGR